MGIKECEVVEGVLEGHWGVGEGGGRVLEGDGALGWLG